MSFLLALIFLGIFLVAPAVGIWYLSRDWRVLSLAGAFALILVAAGLMLLFLFAGGLCGRYDFPAVSSPDGLSSASVSEEDCGATDSFHTSVQLWRRERGTETVLTIGNDPSLIEFEWKGPNMLAIRYPNDSTAPNEFSCRSPWEDFQIECVPYAPDYRKPARQRPPVKMLFQ